MTRDREHEGDTPWQCPRCRRSVALLAAACAALILIAAAFGG